MNNVDCMFIILDHFYLHFILFRLIFFLELLISIFSFQKYIYVQSALRSYKYDFILVYYVFKFLEKTLINGYSLFLKVFIKFA